MIPTPPRRQEVDKLGEVLARLPVGYSLIPSQVFNFFIMDHDGHNRGYVTEDCEVRWWMVGGSEPGE